MAQLLSSYLYIRVKVIAVQIDTTLETTQFMNAVTDFTSVRILCCALGTETDRAQLDRHRLRDS